LRYIEKSHDLGNFVLSKESDRNLARFRIRSSQLTRLGEKYMFQMDITSGFVNQPGKVRYGCPEPKNPSLN